MDVLTVHGVAEALQVCEKTVRRLLADGALPAFRVGRAWRIRRSAVDTYIDRQQVKASPRGALPTPSVRDLEGWDHFK